MDVSHDPVNHPAHYAANKIAGLECIDVTRHFHFSPGNTIKYVWRTGYKIDDLEDLDKAEFYLRDTVEYLPVVGHSAQVVARQLSECLDMGTRELIVVSIVSAIASENFIAAQRGIDSMRDYVTRIHSRKVD